VKSIQSWVVAIGAVWLSGVAVAQQPPTRPITLDIQAQPIEGALNAFARQAGVQVLFYSRLVEGLDAPRLTGKYTPEAALAQLLSGTSLRYEFINDRTVAIRSAKSSEARSNPPIGSSNAGSAELHLADGSTTDVETARQALWRRLAEAEGNASDTGPMPPPRSNEASESSLEEIIVTAQKREQRLQDVPVPVSVVNTEKLADSGQVLLRDYASSVPGFEVTPGIYPGSVSILSIRGVNSGGGGPTVGVLIDDVPYGSSYGGHVGADVPDIDPGDLARVEILRGPQGTLYGADSMGGLVKFVTKDPSTDGYSGRVEAGTNSVHNGAEPGFSLRGSVNIPISDTVAVRASAFRRQDAGYIDNAVAHLDGVNQAEADGGRLSMLWRPGANVSLKISALYQHIKTNGAPDSDVLPGLGDLQQNYIATVPGYRTGVGGTERTDQFYSAVLNAKLAGIDLTSVTGYGHDDSYNSLDYSSAFGASAEKYYGVTGAPIYNRDSTRTLSQEIRLSSTLWNKLDWRVGGFYSHELEQNFQNSDAVNTTTGQIVGPGLFQYYFLGHPKFQEYAGFADLTYHFTDRFNIQIGGRESRITYDVPTNVLIYGGPPSLTPPESASSSPFTYLITPQFTVSPDLMLYARFASGFRPGAPNTPIPGVPRQVNPDKTQTYEAGLKGDFLEHVLSVDTSVYYVDYKDLQITLKTPGGVFYSANGGEAKSQGVEFSITARPLAGLSVSGWIDYQNAVLTQNFPGNSTAYGVSGNRLPGSERFSGNIALEQEFALWNTATGVIGGSVNFVGDRTGNFQATALRQDFPSYAKADLHAGVRYPSWTVTLYVNNVGDTRGVLGGGLDAAPIYSFTFIQPRTVGLSASHDF